MIALLLNILGFKAVWIATVLGAGRGYAVAGLAAYGVFLSLQLSASTQSRRDLLLASLLAPAGWIVDCGYAALNLMRFADAWPAAPLAPWWIALLWANFALLVNHSIAPLRHRPWLAAGLGAIGGPMAYLTAHQLGAVTFPAGRAVVLAVLAGTWAAAMPLIFAVNRRLTRRMQIRRRTA